MPEPRCTFMPTPRIVGPCGPVAVVATGLTARLCPPVQHHERWHHQRDHALPGRDRAGQCGHPRASWRWSSPARPATRCARCWARRCWPTPSMGSAGTMCSSSAAPAPSRSSARWWSLFDGDVWKSIEAPELPSENASSWPPSAVPSSIPKSPSWMLTPEERAALPVPVRADGQRQHAAAGRRSQLPAAGKPMSAGAAAHRRGRRIRPHGPHADRGRGGSARHAMLAGALDRPESPAMGSDATAWLGRASGVTDHSRPGHGPGQRAGADRLHPPRRHAGPPG